MGTVMLPNWNGQYGNLVKFLNQSTLPIKYPEKLLTYEFVIAIYQIIKLIININIFAFL